MALAANLVKVALLVVRSSAPALNQLRLLTFFFSSAESEQHFPCCVAMQANLPQYYTEIREFTSCPGARVQFYNAFRVVVKMWPMQVPSFPNYLTPVEKRLKLIISFKSKKKKN